MSKVSEFEMIAFIEQLGAHGAKLVVALNASTGFTPENPNPLTKGMTRIIVEVEERFKNER